MHDSRTPRGVCGLKCFRRRRIRYPHLVAPFAGAWIEIKSARESYAKTTRSHPSRVRGLKFAYIGEPNFARESHPSRVRGLKSLLKVTLYCTLMSHPSRVRGLK